MWVCSQGREDPLEKEMATHPSILAWRIPWTEEPPGSHDLADEVLQCHVCLRPQRPETWLYFLISVSDL